MREYCTSAIVLGTDSSGEHDRVAFLYTEAVGRVDARIVGGRRTHSRLTPHFALGSHVAARLVYKNRFTVTDVLPGGFFGDDDFSDRPDSEYLAVLQLVRALAAPHIPDPELWHGLFAARFSPCDRRDFMRLLGYDTTHARCFFCGDGRIAVFRITEEAFLCARCARGRVPAAV